jgi:acetoin utilization protein AcuB
MLVQYWMTKDVTTVTEDHTLSEALALLRDKKIRRLPVMKDGKLCGIMSNSDLFRFTGPGITKILEPAAEVLTELEKYKVAEVMINDPITCTPNTPLEEAAELMRTNKISDLPVLNKEKLVGIITESDIFKAFTSIARLNEKGKRLCFRMPVEEKSNVFFKILQMCELKEIDILTILTHPVENEGAHLVMMRVAGEEVEEFIKELWNSNYKVLLMD